MESNADVFGEFGIGRLPRQVHIVFACLIFISPFLVTMQSIRMFYNMFVNPPPKRERTIEEDSEFVQAPKKVAGEEEKKEETKGKKEK